MNNFCSIIKSRVQREQEKRMVAVWLRFCKAPRNDEIALQHFFSFLQQRKNFFLLHLCCMQFFSSDKRLQEIFFKIPPPPAPSRVKWSAPKMTFEPLGRINFWKTVSGSRHSITAECHFRWLWRNKCPNHKNAFSCSAGGSYVQIRQAIRRKAFP